MSIVTYISQLIHVPKHIAVSSSYIIPLLKAYLRGTYDYIRYGHIGLGLERKCDVKSHDHLFVVRLHSAYLKVLSLLSEATELKPLMKKVKRMKTMASKYRHRVVFIDEGAHIGKYTILLLQLVDKVIVLEPDPRNFVLLKYIIKLNNIPNVIVLPLATTYAVWVFNQTRCFSISITLIAIAFTFIGIMLAVAAMILYAIARVRNLIR